ncbi:hypothetical protein ACPPVQ_05920 [Diaminobutyricibacter sp. McL0618]|uniref:hypothetical protein n=1 Tax=Leifsonia sp. McL0618 TaxID=3415677 RepID=UPI003CF064E2
MSDAPHNEAFASAVHRRRPYVVVLLAVGALAVIGGVIWALTAKAVKTVFSGPLPTLPVYTNAQFTQHTESSLVPDYTGVWIGLLVAVIGVTILLAGVVGALTKPRLP